MAQAAIVRDRSTWAAYLLLGYFAYLQTALGPVLPFVRAEGGLSYTATSLHGSAFALGSVLVGVSGERLHRRLGRPGSL